MTRLKRILVGQSPARTIARAALLAFFSLLVFGFLARPVKFAGISMEPTYANGSFRFMSPALVHLRPLKRGDVVAIRMPGDRTFYAKRIVGLPGEKIAFSHGQLIINDQPMAEAYIRERGSWNFDGGTVPEGKFFVTGDNRLTSFEGHVMGFVHRDKIAGVIIP